MFWFVRQSLSTHVCLLNLNVCVCVVVFQLNFSLLTFHGLYQFQLFLFVCLFVCWSVMPMNLTPDSLLCR